MERILLCMKSGERLLVNVEVEGGSVSEVDRLSMEKVRDIINSHDESEAFLQRPAELVTVLC